MEQAKKLKEKIAEEERKQKEREKMFESASSKCN